MLPFSEDAFFANLEAYNRAIFPAQAVAYALAVLALLLIVRPLKGGDRVIAAILALAWAWNGIAYHYLHFSTINIAAPAFAALFLLQALLLLWSGVLRGRLAFIFRPDLRGWSGLAFALFALLLYPLLGWLLGHGWPRAPLLGTAPCPTAIFTLGLLLLLRERVPRALLAIPVLWSLIGGSAAFLLGVTEDLALLVAGLAAPALAVVGRRGS